MKNLLLQARVVTDPIKNKLVGWWNEYYFFYVKHRDLYERDLLTSMVLDPSADLSTLDHATKVEHYHTKGTGLAINWVDMCLTRVVDEYFRSEGETAATASIGNLPAANIANSSWLDSALNDDQVTAIAEDQDLTSLTAGQGDGTASVFTSEIEKAMRSYEFARAHNLTDMTYEDYLKTYGLRVQAEELHKPELVRFIRDWSYPTNTVEPTTGVPSSAVSWTVAERADKDRFFREPGFLFGVTVCRPKIYLKGCNTNAVQMMNDAFSWLPAILSDDPWSSMRRMDAGEPPLDSNTDDYWVDIKDLFLYYPYNSFSILVDLCIGS
jgi:hypothetical protein